VVPLDAGVILGLLLGAPMAAVLVLASWAFQRFARKRGLVPPDKRVWVERKGVAGAAASLLGLYAAGLAWGILVEPRWIQLTRTELGVERPVLGKQRYRIAHLTDLHLEGFGRREERMVELVRDAKPHVILLGGDLVNAREGVGALDRLLRQLQAIAPVYGVGGHTDAKFVTKEACRRAGVPFLEDESVRVPGEGRGLRLVGQQVYPLRPLRELLRGLSDDAYTVFLHHSPDAVDELRAREPGQRVDLFLCGHTHGGQVCLPFWGAILTFSRHHKAYERGRYDVDGVPMYVNRGVGVQGLPVRFLARPEVALIDLVQR
jgi:hypothetical protein